MQAPSRLFDLLCSIQAVLAPCIIVSLTVIMRRLCIQRGETEGRWQPLRASALRLRYWIAFITFLVFRLAPGWNAPAGDLDRESVPSSRIRDRRASNSSAARLVVWGRLA